MKVKLVKKKRVSEGKPGISGKSDYPVVYLFQIP
jgi:hypothetical protein